MRTTYLSSGNMRYADESDYKWFSDNDLDTYHYFRYEPVKWRVYEVNENNLLLTSSKMLDLCNYGDNKVDADNDYAKVQADSYKNSKLRTFLNGLGADENAAKFDCKDKGMLQLMFTEDERSYLIAVDTTNGTNDLMTVPSVEDVSGDLGYAHGFYKKKSAESNMRKTFTTDFAGTSFESPLLRNDPKKSSSSNTLLVYQISTQGDITTIFQDYTLGVLPMVKVSLDCPSLQKVEDEE